MMLWDRVILLPEGSAGTGLLRSLQILMAIGLSPQERYKKLAWLRGTGIDGHTVDSGGGGLGVE